MSSPSLAAVRLFPGTVPSSCVLEEKSRLSHSLIWNWMRAFYDQHGVEAWRNNVVPNFVTTNCCVARMYARVVLAFLHDCFTHKCEGLEVDTTEPVYLVELGAGHGKFGFLLLKQLCQLREFWPRLDECKGRVAPFKLVLTDFTMTNISAWMSHASFQPFIKEGLVDFATFDAEHDLSMKLLLSGDVLSQHTIKNPLVVMANYLFDTLRHEAFRIVDGQLKEALMTVTSERAAEPDLNDPGLITRFRASWTYRDVDTSSGVHYFTGRDQDLNLVLARLLRRPQLQNSSVILPLGGIACMRNMLEMTGGRLLVLTGDKGYNHEAEMTGMRDPHIAIHGSFSLMVNYDAVRHWFETKGGFSMHTPKFDGFKVSLFHRGAEPEALGRTRLAFQDGLAGFDPHTFATLQRCIKDETPQPSLRHVMSLIILSGHDPDVFYKFKQFLLDKVGYPHTNDKQQADVKRTLLGVYDNYFPLSRTKDVAFEIGRLFMSMKDYTTAIQFFLDSLLEFGDHQVTFYNLGLCRFYSGEYQQALVDFATSVDMCPEYREAAEWHARTKLKIVSTGGTPVGPVDLAVPSTPTTPSRWNTGTHTPHRASPSLLVAPSTPAAAPGPHSGPGPDSGDAQ